MKIPMNIRWIIIPTILLVGCTTVGNQNYSALSESIDDIVLNENHVVNLNNGREYHIEKGVYRAIGQDKSGTYFVGPEACLTIEYQEDDNKPEFGNIFNCGFYWAENRLDSVYLFVFGEPRQTSYTQGQLVSNIALVSEHGLYGVLVGSLASAIVSGPVRGKNSSTTL